MIQEEKKQCFGRDANKPGVNCDQPGVYETFPIRGRDYSSSLCQRHFEKFKKGEFDPVADFAGFITFD